MFNRTGSRLSASLVLRVALFLALVYALWAFVIAPRNKNALSHVEIEPDIDPKQLKKGGDHVSNPVSFGLFVMSQCPDAAYCEAHFKPLIKSAIAPVMNVTMNFIATQSGDKFTCPHGARECDGNMAQVCAQALSPAKWSGLAPFASIYGCIRFDFVLCQSDDPWGIPENAMRCANKVGLDFNALDECMKGARGIELMSQNVARTQELGVRKSCTLYLNGEHYCLRDGGRWQPGCKSANNQKIAQELCDLAAEKNAREEMPAICFDAEMLKAALPISS